jgi:ABC-type transport system involved in multi-copper enzyme maturation permease subunit
MLWTLIEKELKNIITGPKFTITFLISAILIIMSVWIGIQDYRAAQQQYEAGIQLTQQKMSETHSWMIFSTQIYRQPNPLQIFNAGISNDIGRFSVVRPSESIKVTNSIYADDPIFAIFRFLDLSFIIQIVLSLLAILFTYDAINGERENGTLRLIFSNAVPRFKYILAKFIGSWLGLVIPLLIPFLLGFLLFQVYQIQFSGDQWIRILIFGGISLLYFTFFVGFGILVSALTRNSSGSFLILLVCWVSLVLIIPRVGSMFAARILPVPSLAEIEGQIDGFSKDRWNQYMQDIEKQLREREKQLAALTPAERETHNQENMWKWMETSDAARRKVQEDINQVSRRLREELRNKKIVQERFAFLLARFSPVSAYQLSSMNLTGTDINLKVRFENALEIYHQIISDFVEQKRKEDGSMGGIRITVDTGKGLSIQSDRNKGKIDLKDLPQFQAIESDFGEIISRSIVDLGILLFYLIISVVGGFVVFLKYDVR